MKVRFLLLCLLLSFCIAAGAKGQAPPKVRVTAESFKARDEGPKKDVTECWSHKITVQNTSGAEMRDLEVRYRIYLHEEISEDKPETPLTHIEATLPAQSLKKGGIITVNTPELKIAVGSSKKVKVNRDILKGVWVRIFSKDGVEVGSFVNPPSLVKSMPWK